MKYNNNNNNNNVLANQYYDILKNIMNNKECKCTQKYINVLNYLLNAINPKDTEKYSIDYIKLLDAILVRAKINNKEIYLEAWDINKDANIVNIKIIENGKHIYNNIDAIFNLNLQKYIYYNNNNNNE